MKAKVIFTVSFFIVLQCLSALLAWLCGYDFDQRGPVVGAWVVASLSFGTWPTCVLWEVINDR